MMRRFLSGFILLLIFIIFNTSLIFAGSSGCSFTWDNYTVLDSDRTFLCLDIENGANIDFNGYKVTVLGDVYMYGGRVSIDNGTFDIGSAGGNLTIEDGVMDIDNGKLIVHDNMTITGYGSLYMDNPYDYVLVQGEFTVENYMEYSNILTNGKLEVKGDFSQYEMENNFFTSDNHTVVLSGSSAQKVRFAYSSKEGSHFSNLVILNPDVEFLDNVTATAVYTPYCLTNEVPKFDNLTYDNMTYFCNDNITLSDNRTVQGNFIFSGGSLNLNGKTLNIEGMFTQNSGTIYFNNGELKVFGYNLKGDSYISMENEKDHMVVNKNLTIDSSIPNIGITDGIIDLFGDLTINSILKLGNNSKLVFNGDFDIYMDINQTLLGNSDNVSLEFGNVIIKNDLIDYEGEPIPSYFVTDVKCDLPNSDFYYLTYFDSDISIICSGKNLSLNNDVYIPYNVIFDNYSVIKLNGFGIYCEGSMKLFNSVLDIDNGFLTVGIPNDYDVTGYVFSTSYTDNVTYKLIQDNSSIKLDNGSLEIFGDYFVKDNSTIDISGDSGLINVYGNFYMESTVSQKEHLINGEVVITGNIYQHNGNPMNLQTSGNNTITLAGDELQTIYIESDATYIENLFLMNDKILIDSADNQSLNVNNLILMYPETLDGLAIASDNITTLDGQPVLKEMLQLKQGWNLCSLPVNEFIANLNDKFSDFSDSISIIWKYVGGYQGSSGGGWEVWMPDNSTLKTIVETYGLVDLNEDGIYPGEGFWILANSSEVIPFYGTLFNMDILNEYIGSSAYSWILIGTGEDISVNNFFSDYERKFWKWDSENQTWKFWSSDEFVRNVAKQYGITIINTIKKGEGFWFWVNSGI